jgi:hypothetical protein
MQVFPLARPHTHTSPISAQSSSTKLEPSLIPLAPTYQIPDRPYVQPADGRKPRWSTHRWIAAESYGSIGTHGGNQILHHDKQSRCSLTTIPFLPLWHTKVYHPKLHWKDGADWSIGARWVTPSRELCRCYRCCVPLDKSIGRLGQDHTSSLQDQLDAIGIEAHSEKWHLPFDLFCRWW